jgi:hypothetical protein
MIGFRASWHKETKPKKQEQELIPEMIPGSAMEHILEIQTRIFEHEQFMLTTKFARLSKAKKQDVIGAYNFLVKTLALVQPTVSSAGITEFGYIDSQVD